MSGPFFQLSRDKILVTSSYEKHVLADILTCCREVTAGIMVLTGATDSGDGQSFGKELLP